MRIAVPVTGEDVSERFGACEALRFFEDDHGRITREFSAAMEMPGFDAALAVLERHGADVVLCGALTAEEKRALAMSGLLIAEGTRCTANEAVRAYLNATVVCDPNNTCNYCGHRENCDVAHK